MLISEKEKAKIAQWCLTLCDLMRCSLPGSSVHGILQARILEWIAIPFSRGSSQPRDGAQVSHIAGTFFPEIAGKPKNTGVGSLSLLQGIFLTQGSKWGLLLCWWMLYQLSYQRSPNILIEPVVFNMLLRYCTRRCRYATHNIMKAAHWIMK